MKKTINILRVILSISLVCSAILIISNFVQLNKLHYDNEKATIIKNIIIQFYYLFLGVTFLIFLDTLLEFETKTNKQIKEHKIYIEDLQNDVRTLKQELYELKNANDNKDNTDNGNINI